MYTINKLKFILLLCLFSTHTIIYAQQRHIVNVTADTPDIFLGDGVCGDIDGNCSLRAAIMQANASPSTDTIHFNLAGVGPFTIAPTSLYPPILAPLVIDGSTQAGYTQYNPMIRLSGILQGAGGEGLTIVSDDCTIRGLAIGGFQEDANGDFGTGILLINAQSCTIIDNLIGIDTDGETPFSNFVGISLDVFSTANQIGAINSGNIISANTSSGIALKLSCTANQIQANFIGTNKDGTQAVGNNNGIVLDNESNLNLIGGTNVAARNIISGNLKSGVEITNSTGNILFGNYIGIDVLGINALANNKGIFLLASAADFNQIGGGNASEGNIISGNTQMGIDLQGSGNLIFGNLIGTQADSISALPNGPVGIWIQNGQNNQIGSEIAGTGNIIAHHIGDGIRIDRGGLSNAFQNQVSRNSIFGNANLGIDLGYSDLATTGPTYIDADDADTGPNNLQNFASISAPSYDELTQTLSLTYEIISSLANASFPMVVEFFVADDKGQGKTFIGSDNYTLIDFLTGSEKSISINTLIPLTGNLDLVNTVTDANNNTSEFNADAPLAAMELDFSARLESRGILLSWKIDAPFHSSYQLERLNPDASFSTLADRLFDETEAVGFFLDEAPFAGRNIYRLQLTNQQGHTSYSPLVELWWEKKEAMIFEIYPNPAYNQARLRIKGLQPDMLKLELYTLSGKLIDAWKIEQMSSSHLIPLPIEGLSSGMYLLRAYAVKEHIYKEMKLIITD